MKCPSCGHDKIILCELAPIGGVYIDPLTEEETPRLRCAQCGSAIIMAQVQPSRPPKGGRARLRTYDRQEPQDDRF